jgi:hypothetical protein
MAMLYHFQVRLLLFWDESICAPVLSIFSAAGESWRTFYSFIAFASSSSTFLLHLPSSEFRTVENSQW